jgi:hypothetical protein
VKQEESQKTPACMIYKMAEEAMTIIIHKVGKKEKGELIDLMRGVMRESVQIIDGAEYERLKEEMK